MTLRFADCELDLARVVLRRSGREVKIEPQVYDVLCHLIAHRGEVVRKEQLLDEVWGDRFVSESALTTRIKVLRRAVGDDGVRQEVIRTVHGKGYEFVAAVHEVDDSSAPETIDPRPSAASRLPVAVQQLIGRTALLDVLVRELEVHRLITLVGSGGVGKTSVGFELARRVEADYADGVHVVELVSIVDEDATFAAFATSLDVSLRRRSSIDDAIIEMLRPRHCLMLLDNCEHLIEPVADLVSRILREAPAVSVIATSRERFAIAGEHVWAVEPLSTAGAQTMDAEGVMSVPAVALFVERVRAADPAFILDATTAPLVVEICRRLDGVPLAIELAAARARVIDVAEIARRLDERFGLLKALRRGSDPRHRTMDDAIGWSYDLLTPDEQVLFMSLSVFAGPFELLSAEAMCPAGEPLDLLTRLSERSMLTVRRPPDGGTRYELLETLREYGRARLDVDRHVQLFSAHARHFAGVAGEVQVELQGPREKLAIRRAEGSFADLRAAQRFAIEISDLDTAFTIIASIREFAMRAMRYEMLVWADAARVAVGAVDHPLLPTLCGISAYGAWVRGEFDLAESLAHETRRLELALGIEPSGLAERVLANVLYVLGQGSRGHAEASRQIELAEQSGNLSDLVHACYMGSVALSSLGDASEALALVARARELALRTGSSTDLASAAVAEGFASTGDDDAALSAFMESDRLASAAGNRWMSAFARTETSGLLVHRGDIVRGCAGLAEMVDLWFRAGDWSQQWHTLSRCVIALDRIGQRELAAEVIGAIEAHATLGVAPMSTTLRTVAFETRDEVMAALGDERAAMLRARGASRPVVTVVHHVRSALLNQSR